MSKFLCVLAGYDYNTGSKLQGIQDHLYEIGFDGVQTKDIPMHITLGTYEVTKEEEEVPVETGVPEEAGEPEAAGINEETGVTEEVGMTGEAAGKTVAEDEGVTVPEAMTADGVMNVAEDVDSGAGSSWFGPAQEPRHRGGLGDRPGNG